MRVGKAISCTQITYTGAPLGCLVSCIKADCRSNSNVDFNSDVNLLIKFVDDTSLSGFVEQDEAAYRGGVQELVEWCDSNYFELNVTKAQELVACRLSSSPNRPEHEPITIKGQSVGTVRAYKYLGTVTDDKLFWTSPFPPPHTHTDACHKKHKRNCTSRRSCSSSKKTRQLCSCFTRMPYFATSCFFSNAKKGGT